MKNFSKLLFILLLFFSSIVFADTSDYISNVTFSPESIAMNNSGEIEIKFDLPAVDNVDRVYIEIEKNNSLQEIVATEISDFSATDNTITLKAKDVLAMLRNSTNFLSKTTYAQTDDSDIISDEDTTIADEDTAQVDEDISDTDILPRDEDTETQDEDSDIDSTKTFDNQYDGSYSCKITVKMKSGNSDDGETSDSDTIVTTTPSSVSFNFTLVLDNVPPKKPLKATTQGGDSKIYITVTPPKEDLLGNAGEKIGKYITIATGFFKKDGKEIKKTIEFSNEVTLDDAQEEYKYEISSKDGYSLINNDSNDSKYVYQLKIVAEDQAGNVDKTEYITTTGSAITTSGFWSNYKKHGGNEDGGYCFIATASFGSYINPYVKILRKFRDVFLLTNAPGTKFVNLYYEYGSKFAKIMMNHPVLKPIVRVLLIPLIIFAYMLLNPFFILFLIAPFVILIFTFLKKHKKTKNILPIIFLFIFLPHNLFALEGSFAFINSFYYPKKIDENTSNSFKEVGDDNLRYFPKIVFGMDLPFLKNYLKITPETGIGYTRFHGHNISSAGNKTPEYTAFYMIPLIADIKIKPVYNFFLKPFIAGGGDYIFWWIKESDTTIKKGGTMGYHFSLGLELSLNWLDEASAIKMRETSGIYDTSLFVAFRFEKIDDFSSSKSFDFSNNRIEFGLNFDY